MKIKINKLIGKLEIHCHGEKRVNTSDIEEQIKEALLNAVNKSTPQKEECDRKIVIEQDFFTQKEGAIRKIETIRTKVTENGVLILDKENSSEDYRCSELKDAIDYIVKGQRAKKIKVHRTTQEFYQTLKAQGNYNLYVITENLDQSGDVCMNVYTPNSCVSEEEKESFNALLENITPYILKRTEDFKDE